MNVKGEMVQNTIAVTSMQDAMTEIQEIEGTPCLLYTSDAADE